MPLASPFQTLPDEPADGSLDDNAFITLLDLNKEGNELVASTYFGGAAVLTI